MIQSDQSRIDSVDVIRGIALYGILVVNIFVFNISFLYFFDYYSGFTGFEKAVEVFVLEAFTGKFMFLFAFLFGFSSWLQYKKYASLKDFAPYWIWRLLVLFLFGVVHLLFFWSGDILLPYALLGFFLLLLINKPLKVLIPLSLFFLFFPALFYLFEVLVVGLPAPGIEKPKLENFVKVFSSGTFQEIFSFRMKEYLSFRNEKLVFYMPKEFALFLMGIIAGKINLPGLINRNKKLFFKISIGILSLLIFRLIYKNSLPSFNPMADNKWVNVLPIALHILLETLQGVLYILALFLLWEVRNVRSILGSFKYAGRMALSNYFFQSLVCVFIFYSYGFGLYGKLAPVQLFALASGIFLLQLWVSKWWLKYFQQGPLEMLWRRLSKPGKFVLYRQ